MMEDLLHRIACRIRGHDWRVFGEPNRGGLRLCRRCPRVETLR